MELALRVDNMETAVPKLYPDTLQAQRLSAQAGPCPTCGQNARLGMGAPSPQSGPPTHERCFRKGTPRRGRCPARGPRVIPRDASTLPTRTGHLPSYLAPSLMPQLHGALEQKAGGESTVSVLVTHGIAPNTWTPRRGNHHSWHYSMRLRLDAQGLSTRIGDYHLTSRPLPVNAHRHDPLHGTTTRKGAGPRRRVSYPTAAAPRGHPGAGGTLLAPTLIPTIIAQWVSLR